MKALLLIAGLTACATSQPHTKENTMTHQNREQLTNFMDEVMSKGNIDAADKYMHADAIDHAPWPGQPANLEGFKAGLAQLRTSFPDLKVDIERLVSEGDMIVSHFAISGSHLGEFMGAPATGKTFRVEAIDIIRMDEGKIAEHWGLMDTASMGEQLGLGH
jgi:steroid delta-isomerase-like uncharacterized protein